MRARRTRLSIRLGALCAGLVAFQHGFGQVRLVSALPPVPYWADPRIHMFGNVGVGGRLHSFVAGPVTQWLDFVAYDNVDIREGILQSVRPGSSICDLGCGVGRSTYRAHLNHFERVVGVDSSQAMIDMANWSSQMAGTPNDRVEFKVANAETYGHTDEFATTLVSFVLHEAPLEGRLAILNNAIRISTEQVIISDICPTYVPSASMLWGEPYLLDYLDRIDRDVMAIAYQNGWHASRSAPVIGRMVTWRLRPMDRVRPAPVETTGDAPERS